MISEQQTADSRQQTADSRHYVKWDQIKSSRLYDFVAENPPLKETYFAYQVGRAIVNFTKYFVSNLQSVKVLDYGCGLGFLSEYFLQESIQMYGVDMSQESVNVCNEKFKNYRTWQGALIFDGNRLPYDDDTFDVITCTEVIEHILEIHMDLFLKELKRILKPGGKIIMTTPNDENFTRNYVCCPECNCVFHRHGHVNKFTKDSLSALMEKYGYETIICDCTNFYRFQESMPKFNLMTVNLNFILNEIRCLKRKVKDRAYKNTPKSIEFLSRIGDGANLFWVGTK